MQALAKKHTQAPQPIKFPGSKKTRTETCPKHGQYEAEFVIKGSTRDIYSRCPRCEAEFEAAQDEIKNQERAERIAGMMANSGIPKRFRLCTINGFQAGNEGAAHAKSVSKGYVDSFETLKESGASLVFCGSPGTGKTHLACAIQKAVIGKGISAKYTTVFQMMSAIKSTYGKNSDQTESQAIKAYSGCGLLVIDEVGVQYGSDSEKILFYQIINGRYEEMLPTILISNLVESELVAFIGERCIDRMRDGGGAVVPFAWESHRK